MKRKLGINKENFFYCY